MGIFVYEVRVIVIFWAVFNFVLVEDIFKVVYWNSEIIFINFYLRDMLGFFE